jgi:hypothetical protein
MLDLICVERWEEIGVVIALDNVLRARVAPGCGLKYFNISDSNGWVGWIVRYNIIQMFGVAHVTSA